MASLSAYTDEIQEAMLADQFGLRRQLKAMQRAERQGRPFDRNLGRFQEQLKASCGRRQQRLRSVPTISWPEDLPVVARRTEIADAIREHQVVVVCGETGSGKSTQLPKIVLELGRGVSGVIGHTQPRRIAARSIASRVAEELKCQNGQQVGYTIRFNDASGPNTLVRLMTDGILLAESQSDRFLSQYDTIIVDEAHERSLNIDFLLGYLKRLLPQRPDLRVIITSATIDADRFSDYFATDHSPVPVILVEGRTYPVETRYQPLESLSADGEIQERDWMDGLMDAVDGLANESYGHILVFLPTERDIREADRRLSGRSWPGDSPGNPTQIVPLFGRLSMSDQTRVFRTYQHRRIVLATNVAESSVTVPGISSVVDTGTARISRYSARSRMQRLPIEPVSQASARQRAGRCGRIGPGVCVRLYSETDFESRDEFTQPEIQRTNLAAVILRTLSLKLGRLEEFPFLDPPKPTTIREGYRTLEELGAIRVDDADVALTKVGQRMARLPVDPRISRMVLAAIDEQAASEVLIIASALEVQDPRERPLEKQQAADEAHRAFRHESSDFLSWLNLWDAWHENKKKLSGGQLKKWCNRNFLSWLRMREWIDVHRQLRDLLKDSGDRDLVRAARLHPHNDRRNDYAAIHRALITGLLSNLAWKTAEREFTGAGGQKLTVWPGSTLSAKPPKWLVAGELIETGRRYARTIARIQPEWVEGIAEHLLKREVTEPHWDGKAGNVMAFEKLSLWGLPIVPRRRTSLARHDAVKARELLIQHGIVELGLLYGETSEQRQSRFAQEELELDAGTRSRITPGHETHATASSSRKPAWASQLRFLQNNADVLEELRGLQVRTRRHDVLPSDETLFQIYDEQIPADICDRERLGKWYQRKAKKESTLLQLTVDQFVTPKHQERSATDFPGELVIGKLQLPLTYELLPGAHEDGVTVTVPAEALSQLPEDRLEWLVPGMIEQKVTVLIRSLPKALRHLFVPVPDTTRQVCSELVFADGSLANQLAQRLSRIAGEPVPPDQLTNVELPDYLQMMVRVVDENAKLLAEGRSLSELRIQLAEVDRQRTPAESQDPAERQWFRSGFTSWEFNDVPLSIGVQRAGIPIQMWPAIQDDGDSVSLTLCQSAAQAQAVLKRGLRRLVLIREASQIRKRIRNLGGLNQIQLLASSIRGIQLQQHLQLLMVERAYLSGRQLPRTRAEFEASLLKGRENQSAVAAEFVVFLPRLFDEYHQTRRLLDEARIPGAESLVKGMKQQLKELVTADFLATTPWAWLIQYPRYFDCMRQRLRRMRSGGMATELELTEVLRRHSDRLVQRRQHQAQYNSLLEHYRWMLEEFRVSLFAPRLGTAVKVSAEKLDEHWQTIP